MPRRGALVRGRIVQNGAAHCVIERRNARAAAREPAAIFAFDLLWLEGEHLRARPSLERKSALSDALGQGGRVRHVGHVASSSTALWQVAAQFELEGIVAEDSASEDRAGRSDRWLKIETPTGARRERQRRAR